MLSMLRLRMPSNSNVETMLVQHYLEKGSHRSGNVACGNDATSRPTRRQIKLAMMPQAVLYKTTISAGKMPKTRQVWSHTATRSSIIPQKCGSGSNEATIVI
jgi:hypothetical protein